MNTKLNIIYTLALTCTTLCITSCHTTPSQTDAITSATPKYDHDAPINLPPPSDTYMVLGKIEGLKNFVVKYDGNLYRGGEPYSPEGFKALDKIGIQTIISITPTDSERELAQKHNIKLVEIILTKDMGISQDDFNKFTSSLNNDKGPFYLHCKGGVHRGGTMGIAYRINQCGWTREKAIEEFDKLGGNPTKDRLMLDSIMNNAQ